MKKIKVIPKKIRFKYYREIVKAYKKAQENRKTCLGIMPSFIFDTFQVHEAGFCYIFNKLNDRDHIPNWSLRNVSEILPEIYKNRTTPGPYWYKDEKDRYDTLIKILNNEKKQSKNSIKHKMLVNKRKSL